MTRFILIFIFILQPLIYLFGIGRDIIPSNVLDGFLILLFLFTLFKNRELPVRLDVYILISVFIITLFASLSYVNTIFFMELKGVALISIGLMSRYTKINFEDFYNILIIYCLVLLLYILSTFSFSNYNRYELGLVGEINYDVALLVISLAFFKSINYNKKKFKILFFICLIISLLSASRSAILSLFFIFIYGKINIKGIFQVTFLGYILFSSLILLRQNSLNLLSIDRFVFIAEFLEYVKNSYSFIFPSRLGTPLYLDSYLGSFNFYVDDMSTRNNISGVFPFMYHSFVLRFTTQFGLISLILFCSIIFKDLKKYKLFMFVIFIYSLTLSLFYIASISCLVFILIKQLGNNKLCEN